MHLVLPYFRTFVCEPCSVTLPDASMVKWTTLEPYLDLSESNSKMYTNFEFFVEKSIKIKKKKKHTLIYKAK